jgi:hypothetical protein
MIVAVPYAGTTLTSMSGIMNFTSPEYWDSERQRVETSSTDIYSNYNLLHDRPNPVFPEPSKIPIITRPLLNPRVPD